MSRQHFSFVILFIGLALAGGAYAANSSAPSPPSNNTSFFFPETPFISTVNATVVPSDYSDYEVPMNLAPDGVKVVQDDLPLVEEEDKEADEFAQPEGKSDKKANQPKDSASSSYSSSFVVFVVAAGLFLF